jgi:hypothetical protein
VQPPYIFYIRNMGNKTMEKVQKCEVQEQSYVPSPESFKVSFYSVEEFMLVSNSKCM